MADDDDAPGAADTATTTQSAPTSTAPSPQSRPVASGPVPAFRQASHIAVLTVEKEIDRVTLYSLERRIERAMADGATAIVIELNTPGGELSATLDICHLLKNDSPANTVAWVNPNAYSAGTIIALACREIVVSPNSRMGDAAPIHASPMGLMPLPASERAKIESPLLAEVIDSARRNHYDENLVQSFISVGVELWMLEHKDRGERIFVDRAEYRRVFGRDPPEGLTPVTPLSGGRVVQPRVSEIPTEALDPEAQAKEIERMQLRPPNRQPLEAVDADEWKVIMQVVSDDRLLTLNQNEAVYFGLAQNIIANDEQLKAFFDASTIQRYDANWSEGLVRLLMNFYVRVVLIVIFLVALFIELAAPGTGIFGLVALLALALLMGTPMLIGASAWWPIALVVLGVALVLTELFIIPGIGIAGIAGAISLLIGLVASFVTGDMGTGAVQSDVIRGAAATFMGLFVAGVAMWLISRHIYSVPLLDKVILRSELGNEAADGSGDGLLAAMGPAHSATAGGVGIGDVGVTVTALRPSGRGEFNGRVIEIQTSVNYIDAGTAVRVTRITPFAVEVEVIES